MLYELNIVEYRHADGSTYKGFEILCHCPKRGCFDVTPNFYVLHGESAKHDLKLAQGFVKDRNAAAYGVL